MARGNHTSPPYQKFGKRRKSQIKTQKRLENNWKVLKELTDKL